MILGAAIAKVSDSQILCEWANETRDNLLERRALLKNFLREKSFLGSKSTPEHAEHYSLHYVTKKTCVYVALSQKSPSSGHVRNFLEEMQLQFEEVGI